ncbi:MAG: MBL fold metallo-hydrolase [Candidatus Portnoybacteria bacterium]|nr:MBL fold metallo-hydrolase [Candidatus Portnoybacteria bacterium]
MKISWYGQSCFKFSIKSNGGNKIVVFTDPFTKKVGLNPPRGNADIVTISHGHAEHGNVKSLSGNPFCVEGPGEYDVRGIFIKGIHSFHDDKKGKERGTNTIYVLDGEEMKVCHLGDFGQSELANDQLNQIGDVDVLMIPVGGTYTINGSEAVKIINQLEPQIVIPMHFKVSKLKTKLNTVDKFLEEIGTEKEVKEEVSIQRKDLTEGDMKVIVMKPA